MKAMTNELTEINRRVNNLEYVPSNEPAMTAILWRDPEELKEKDLPVLAKIEAGKKCHCPGRQYYALFDDPYYFNKFMSAKHEWDYLYGASKIVAWTPLPKLEEL